MNYPQNLRFAFPWEKCGDMVGEVIKYLQDAQSIVDIGYGNGYLLKVLREKYPQKELLGVEIIHRYPWPKESNIHALSGSTESLPFLNNTFDAVISTFVLDYVDKERAVDEIKRILRYDGKAVLFLHHPKSGLVDKFRKELEANPEDTELRYYIDTLSSNIFKSDEGCERFFGRKMLIEQFGCWEGGDTKGETKRNYCYDIFLRNRAPIWNFINQESHD